MAAICPKFIVRCAAIIIIASLIALFGLLGVAVWAALHLAGVL